MSGMPHSLPCGNASGNAAMALSTIPFRKRICYRFLRSNAMPKQLTDDEFDPDMQDDDELAGAGMHVLGDDEDDDEDDELTLPEGIVLEDVDLDDEALAKLDATEKEDDEERPKSALEELEEMEKALNGEKDEEDEDDEDDFDDEDEL